MEKKECPPEKILNPLTNKCVKKDGKIGKEILKKTKEDKRENKKECPPEKILNPLTNKCVKKDGKIGKEILKKTKEDKKEFRKEDIKEDYILLEPELGTLGSLQLSPNPSLLPTSIESSLKKTIKNKKISVLKLQELYFKNLYKSSLKLSKMNILDRIKEYIKIKDIYLKIKNKKQFCISKNYNESKKEIKNKNIKMIGNDNDLSTIIIEKQIGSKSKYGTVYISHFSDDINLKFAIKLQTKDYGNFINENKILNKLTKLVIDFKTIHFPITYGTLYCSKKINEKIDTKNTSHIIQLNELADGDFTEILLSYIKKKIYNQTIELNINDEIIDNLFIQCLISLMTLYSYTESYHLDSHTGNFLYHKIQSGGYYHYNIYGTDYYLENKGYIIVLWDYGFTSSYKIPNLKLFINYDYEKLITSIEYMNSLIKKENKDKYILENSFNLFKYIKNNANITDVSKIKEFNIQIIKYLVKNLSTFTNNKPSSKIINEKPFIIN